MSPIETVAIGGPGVAPGKCAAHVCPPDPNGCTHSAFAEGEPEIEHTDRCDRERRMRTDGITPKRTPGAYAYDTTYGGVRAACIRRIFGDGTFVIGLARWQDVMRARRMPPVGAALFLGDDRAVEGIGEDAVDILGPDFVGRAAGTDAADARATGAALIEATIAWGDDATATDAAICMQQSRTGRKLLRARKTVDGALILDALTDNVYSRTCKLLATVKTLCNALDDRPALCDDAEAAAAALDDVYFKFQDNHNWAISSLVWGPDEAAAISATATLAPNLQARVETLARFFYYVADATEAAGTNPALAQAVAEARMMAPGASPYPGAFKTVVKVDHSACASIAFKALIKEGCTPVAVSWEKTPFFAAKAPNGTALARAEAALRALPDAYTVDGGAAEYTAHACRHGVWGTHHAAEPELWAYSGLLSHDDFNYTINAEVVNPTNGKSAPPSNLEKSRRRVLYCIQLLNVALRVYEIHYINLADPKKPTMARLTKLGSICAKFNNVHPHDTHPTMLYMPHVMALGCDLNPNFSPTPTDMQKALTIVLHPNSSPTAQLGLTELRAAFTHRGIWAFGEYPNQVNFETLCAFHAGRVVERAMPDAATIVKSGAVMSILFGERLTNHPFPAAVTDAIETGVGEAGRRVRAFYPRHTRVAILDEKRIKTRLDLPSHVKAKVANGHDYCAPWTANHVTALALQKSNHPQHAGADPFYRTANNTVATTASEVDLSRLSRAEEKIFKESCFDVAAMTGAFLLPRLYLQGIYALRFLVLWGEGGSGKSTYTGYIEHMNEPDVSKPRDGKWNDNQFSDGIAGVDIGGERGANGSAIQIVHDAMNCLAKYVPKSAFNNENKDQKIEVKKDPLPMTLMTTDDANFVDPVMAHSSKRRKVCQKTPEEKAFSVQSSAHKARHIVCTNSLSQLFNHEDVLGDVSKPADREAQATAYKRRTIVLNIVKLHTNGINAALDAWTKVDTVEAVEDGMVAVITFGMAVEKMRRKNISDLSELHTHPCAMHGLGLCPDDCPARASFFGHATNAAFADLLRPKLTGALGAATRCLRAHFVPTPNVAITTKGLQKAMGVFDPRTVFSRDIVADAVKIVFSRELTDGRAAGLCSGTLDPWANTYECNCDAAGRPKDSNAHTYCSFPACCDNNGRTSTSVVLGVGPKANAPVVAELD